MFYRFNTWCANLLPYQQLEIGFPYSLPSVLVYPPESAPTQAVKPYKTPRFLTSSDIFDIWAYSVHNVLKWGTEDVQQGLELTGMGATRALQTRFLGSIALKFRE